MRAATAPVQSRSVGLGGALALAGLGLLAAGIAGRAVRQPVVPSGRAPSPRVRREKREALRLARDGAAVLSSSVLLDSAMEHFRGGFHRPEMYAAPATAAVSIAANLAEPGMGRRGAGVQAAHALSLGVGLAGTGFHLWNLWKRPGRIDWNNLFYAAPLGAPGALGVAGLIGAVTHAQATREGRERRHGRQLAALSGVALLGETAEVALLHFRGAFHDPFMWLPVTVPPLAGAALLVEAARPATDPRPLRRLLRGVEALGYLGTGFHVMGVARNMGGWRNWRQTALAGPPVPAPASFTGLAQTGRAALDLIDAGGRG